jgi:hypothetical protein
MDGINVHRLKVDCAVPRDHPNPLAVRTKLDEAAERLPAALGELLAPLDRAGDEVVVIKRLELTFDLDTSLAPGDLARAWAARIAAAVARSLAPESALPLLRFSDEAHYLARFLADSVQARATGTWYYARWRGLDALPLAAQLRTAITDEPSRGIAALATLSRSELMAVLSALGPREAQRVVETAIASATDGDLDAAARVLTALVAQWLPIATALPSPWQSALALVVRAAEALHPSELRPALQLAAAIAVMCARQRTPATSPAHQAGAPFASLAPRAPLAALIDPPPVEPLLAVDPDVRCALLAAAGAEESDDSTTAPAGWYTRLGGLLLLLPRIAELPLHELFGADTPCARLAVLSRAAGHQRRAEVLADPLWRHLCGVALDTDVDDWLAREDIAAPLASIAARHGAVRAERLQLIATRYDQPVAIVVAEPGGEWLGFAPLTRELRAVLRSSPVADGGTHALAAARAAAQALAWLGPDLASPIDRALTACAQQVLRAFARRLPGFSGSSLSFLYDSFLDFDATVLEADGTFHCRVGRPRLAAVFGLTGALRGRLPIGEGRTLELYRE